MVSPRTLLDANYRITGHSETDLLPSDSLLATDRSVGYYQIQPLVQLRPMDRVSGESVKIAGTSISVGFGAGERVS
jgi:hypothetical protein